MSFFSFISEQAFGLDLSNSLSNFCDILDLKWCLNCCIKTLCHSIFYKDHLSLAAGQVPLAILFDAKASMTRYDCHYSNTCLLYGFMWIYIIFLTQYVTKNCLLHKQIRIKLWSFLYKLGFNGIFFFFSIIFITFLSHASKNMENLSKTWIIYLD